MWSTADTAGAFDAVCGWAYEGGYNQWDGWYPGQDAGGPAAVQDLVVVNQSGINSYRKVRTTHISLFIEKQEWNRD